VPPSVVVIQLAVPLICRSPDFTHSPLLPIHFSMPPLSSHSPSPTTAPMAMPRAPGTTTCSAHCSAPSPIETPAPVTSAQDRHSPLQIISHLEVYDDKGNLTYGLSLPGGGAARLFVSHAQAQFDDPRWIQARSKPDEFLATWMVDLGASRGAPASTCRRPLRRQ
jgi:hypothetical protein